jgi:hypothetical protein
VEAKSDSTHEKVRQALAQLLDYAVHAHAKLDALTALFPSAPTTRDVNWLGNYGIGCTYQNEEGGFTSQPPSRHAVVRIKDLWQPAWREQQPVESDTTLGGLAARPLSHLHAGKPISTKRARRDSNSQPSDP